MNVLRAVANMQNLKDNTARWTDDFSSIVPVIYWENGGFDWLTEKLTDLGWWSEKEEDDEDDEEFNFVFDDVSDEDDDREDE